MDLQTQADAFRAQKPGEDVDPSWNLLIGMRLPKSFKTEHAHRQAPVFTHMNDNNFPSLYSDDKMAIYLNSALPYMNAYPGNEGRAAMSFMHLLVVPKERIYNVATMRGEADRALLMDMREVTCLVFNQFQFRKRIEDALMNQNLNLVSADILTQENREAFHQSILDLHKARDSDLSFWFHEHPEHSVGHLHMHVLLDTALTPAFLIHEHKNTPLQKVLALIHSRE